jgi:hypothetical protein
MTPAELRRRLARLHPVGAVTESLERELRRPGHRAPWYETQQEHLLGWLREYDGPGYYGRANWDRSAEFVYNHFNCAPGLLWIAEAAGAPRALLLKAKRAVLAAGPRNPAQSAAVRQVFPWALVEALLNGESSSDAARRRGAAPPRQGRRGRALNAR